MSLTAAMEEAYAANPHDAVLIETLEIDNPSFSAPEYIASGYGSDITLPLTLGGATALFKDIPFVFIPPGHTESGPTPARLNILDVRGDLTSVLNLGTQGNDPISVTWRRYTTADLTQPGDIFSGLFIRSARQTATGIEVPITFREIEMQAFPLATYDAQYYPAIQSGR